MNMTRHLHELTDGYCRKTFESLIEYLNISGATYNVFMWSGTGNERVIRVLVGPWVFHTDVNSVEGPRKFNSLFRINTGIQIPNDEILDFVKELTWIGPTDFTNVEDYSFNTYEKCTFDNLLKYGVIDPLQYECWKMLTQGVT